MTDTTDTTDPAAVAAEKETRWEEAKAAATAAIYDGDGRGMVGRNRPFLLYRVARAIQKEREAAAAEIAKLKAEREWRPIETVFENGRTAPYICVLLGRHDEEPVEGFWSVRDEAWFFDGDDGTQPLGWQPTHWMPVWSPPEVPPLPETSESGGGGDV